MEPTLRIEIFPADLDRTIAFYTRLGFALVRRDDGPPLRYPSMRLGSVRLGAAEREQVDPALRLPPAGTELVVEVDDVQGLRDRFVADGIELAEDVTRRSWGLTDIRLTDPDGYFWRFTSRE